MNKILISFIFFSSILLGDNFLQELQEDGIIVKKDGKTIHIKREKNKKCTKNNLNPEPLFGGDYAGEKVADVCKKSFVTHVGVLQPMRLSKQIETVGEVEILGHIKASEKEPSKYLLIDARTAKWYKQMTIPTAINLPFNTLAYDEDFDEDDFDNQKEYEEYKKNYKNMFKILQITEGKKGLNFENSPSIILFCNGSWCSQSPNAIMALMNMGYPKEKLLWYRGGLQDWLIYDFTIEKPL